jgi:putative peptide zinc metalloprotease protein
MWHVLEDRSSHRYLRLDWPAYRFVSLLDGQRTLEQAWQLCIEELGDEANTQGEVIQQLGQLYAYNLLQSDTVPDIDGMFKRRQKRVHREVRSQLASLMFFRLPLWDPDAFLDAILPLFGWLWSWLGLVLWLGLVSTGLYYVIDQWGHLSDKTQSILDPENIPLLYLSFAIVKVLHEFGHALSCKKFGQQEGSGGEVHTMGVMLLVLTPMPYVDTSSAWALRNKWHRLTIGASGMLVELGVAAVAAIIWAHTSQFTVVRGICYNVMFIASVSTLLFNANPLLRYDGYYVISDLLEIPNFAQRSREYVIYRVKRYAWGLKRLACPAHSFGERVWMSFYGPASVVYRVVILVTILLFLTDRLPKPLLVIGILMMFVSMFMWLCMPLLKFLKYLFTSPELARVRTRAMLSTGLFASGVIYLIAGVELPNRTRLAGITEPVESTVIYAAEDGFLDDCLPHGQIVDQPGSVLVDCRNQELALQAQQIQLQQEMVDCQIRLHREQRKPALVQAFLHQKQVLDRQRNRLNERTERLDRRADHEGIWLARKLDASRGALLPRGAELGQLIRLENIRVRVAASQDVAAQLVAQARPDVAIRLKGRPDVEFAGRIEKILPAGHKQLPAQALSYGAGGSIRTNPQKPEEAAENLFEVWITVTAPPAEHLLSKQRVIVRFDLGDQSLTRQMWLKARRIFQRRFGV